MKKIKLLIFALIGCLILAGCQATSQSTYYNKQIMTMVGMVVNCLDDNDADGLIKKNKERHHTRHFSDE